MTSYPSNANRWEDDCGNTAISPVLLLERPEQVADVFATGHDAAHRATVKHHVPDTLNVVGLAKREDKKLVDKTTKGARMHV